MRKVSIIIISLIFGIPVGLSLATQKTAKKTLSPTSSGFHIPDKYQYKTNTLYPMPRYEKEGWGMPRGAMQTPRPTLTVYQQESIEEANKVIPKDVKAKMVRIYQTNKGLWIKYINPKSILPEYAWFEVFKKENKKPFIFYKHYRDIDLLPGNQGRLLLVMDYECVGCCKVVMVDSETGKNWPLDVQAEKDYLNCHIRRHEGQLFFAVGFSPDDKKVLLQSCDMDWGNGNHEYKPCFYVVDSYTGKILESYKKAQESFVVYNKDWKKGL